MGYQEILDFLSKNNINTSDAMVASTCDSAWLEIKDSGECEWLDFDRFCSACYDVWMDSEDDTGLSRIADMVAEYAINRSELPSSYDDLLFAEEYGYKEGN